MKTKIETNSDLLPKLFSFTKKKYTATQMVDKFPSELGKPLQDSFGVLNKNLSVLLKKETTLCELDLIEKSFINVTEMLINTAVQLWHRKIYLADFHALIQTLKRDLIKIKSNFNVTPHARQFFNIRLLDLTTGEGILCLLNNQLDDAERLFVDNLQEQIHLFHTKNEMYLLKKLLLLTIAEINCRRGYYHFADKIAAEIDCKQIKSTELKFAYFDVAKQLAKYYQQEMYTKAIFWYKQTHAIFLNIKNDETAQMFISLVPELSEFLTQETNLLQAIQQTKENNFNLVKLGIDKLNSPLVECDKNLPIIYLHSLKCYFVKKIIRNIKMKDKDFILISDEKGKVVLSNIAEMDANALLAGLQAVIEAHNSWQEQRNYEALQNNNLISAVQIKNPIQNLITENSSEKEKITLKPKMKTRKPAKPHQQPNVLPIVAKTLNAEMLGFNAKYNDYKIVSFYNDYLPEGIHFGFFDSNGVKKVDEKVLKIHANLLYTKRRIVGKKESGIVMAGDRFKTKNCLDNFRMWATLVDKQKVANHEKFLWSFSQPKTHEKQENLYKNKL